MRPFDEDSIEITPEEFEIQVKNLIENFNRDVKKLEILHNEKMSSREGAFQIDILVTFEFLGADFVILVECKRHNSAIKRETIQVLKDKIQILGAQKGLLVSASGFQKGAIEYAKLHGIALVRILKGEMTYETKSLIRPKALPDWIDLPDFVFHWIQATSTNTIRVTDLDSDYLNDFVDQLISQRNREI